MGSKYKKASLKDLGVELIDCDHKTPKAVEMGIPYIGIPQMDNGRINFDAKPRLISEEDFVKWTRKANPTYGDVILSRRCNSGETVYVPKNRRFALGQNLVLLRPKGDRLFPEYLRYVVKSKEWWDEVAKYLNPGAIFESLKCADIPKFMVPEPPVEAQKKIVEILSAIEDRIELNQQTNQTLEQMAQALFKSWFVHFDPVIDNALAAGNEIPDALQHRVEIRKKAHALQKQKPNIQPLPEATQRLFPSELEHTDEASIGINGWVPKGWQTKSVDECININPRVSLPKGTLAKFADMKALPTSGYGIMDVIEKNYTGGAKFQQGDVLLARITPCLQNGKTGIVDFMDEDNEIGFGSTEFIVMRRKGGLGTPFISCLARDENFRNHCMQSMVGSSGRQRVQNACFSAYFLALPTTENVLNTFQTIVAPMFTRMTINNEETKSLANLRDLLLPKLISGEITT
ncbi:restriction modification system DNA specificity domain protein [Glaciecola sp. 4H-3-7+YE-5]|jgi:type I restriction enzyme S subunit|nr:restriction modification system DNA specificity domain protein [Glaciecola sp. 4H-3-7+YE-5]